MGGTGNSFIKCPSCGSKEINTYNYKNSEIRFCTGCGTTWEKRGYPQEIVVPASRVVGSVIAGVLASVLTSIVTESFPAKTDPIEVKRKKIAMITAGALSSGFIGLLTTLITS